MREFYVPGLKFDTGVTGLRVVSSDNAHDYARVTVRPSEWSGRLSEGTPARVGWGSGEAMRYWHGYVDKVDVTDLDVHVHMYGITYWMKRPRQRVWPSMTVEQIAHELAERYRLDTDVATYGEQLAFSEAQAGESDWAFLLRVANRQGFVVYIDEPTIRVVDRRYVLTRPVQHIDIIQPKTFSASDFKVRERQFNVSALSDAGEVYRVSSDNRQWDTFGGKGEPVYWQEPLTGAVPSGQREAEQMARGVSMATRWKHQATTVIDGDESIRAGSVVRVVDRGVHNGLWYVIEADHSWGKEYDTYLTLGTDSLEEAAPDRPLRRTFDPQDEGYRPNVRLAESAWTSSWKRPLSHQNRAYRR